MCRALERVGAKPRLFGRSVDYLPIRECNLVIVHVRPETLSGCLWLAPLFPLLPLVLIGGHSLLSLDPHSRPIARARGSRKKH